MFVELASITPYDEPPLFARMLEMWCFREYYLLHVFRSHITDVFE